MRSLGHQIVADFYHCDGSTLSDVDYVTDAMLEAARRANCTIVTQTFHHFSPYGVSGAVIVAESHLAIHTGRNMATQRWIFSPAAISSSPRMP
jgi:adenosylmethionine decarboxylase proenzyme (EC 4.1.1.50)